MAKVENPKFEDGMVICEDCPLFDFVVCRDCPTNMEEYAEACKLAEQEAAK